MNSTTQTQSTRLITAENWPLILIALLAIIYTALGLSAGAIGLLGVAGAIAAIAALVVAIRSQSRTAASILLVVGAVPFALATWWSVVVPLTALLILGIGLPQVKRLADQPGLDQILDLRPTGSSR